MREKIRHATGEIVLLRHGNFLENRSATMKARPGVILAPDNCCHIVTGFTSQESFKEGGLSRQICPAGPTTGLRPPSYFWSRRPSRVSRLDIRSHIGWADREMVDAILEYLQLSSGAVQALREYRHSLAGLVAHEIV